MNANPLNPFWLVVTIVFETVILGGGSYLVFVILAPWLSKHESMHIVEGQEKEDMQKVLWGLFSKAKRWPDNFRWFFVSYFIVRGPAFICLMGTEAILLTSVGWKNPLTWDGFYYDMLFARSVNLPNGAHLVSFVPIPALGIYAAWKYPSEDEKSLLLRVFYGAYFGLLIAALGVAIHESLWTLIYYGVYWPYLSWGVLDNVLKDVFFIAMLALFIQTYRKFPFPKVPMRAFKGPTLVYITMLCVWIALGFHISSINNFVYGQGIYGLTQWANDPLTNGLEVFSWDLLYVCMAVVVWKVPNQMGVLSRVVKDPLGNKNE